MNEVKAFIRKQKAEEVVDGLEEEGFCCMTLIDAVGLGMMADPDKARLSIRISERISEVVKLVVVCDEEDTEEVITIICDNARSGQPGDGIVYVTPVMKTIHIRSGEKGDSFLHGRHRMDKRS